MPIDLLLAKALELLTGNQLVKDKLQRTEVVIRVLKQLGLDPEHPPADFEGVYNYALVEYGVGKPKPCLELFRAREIRQVFRTAFDQNNAQLWLASGEQFLESSAIGDEVKTLGLDPKLELATFANCFIVVAKRTRTPGDVLMSHQVASMQQQVMDRLDQIPTLEGIRTELARVAGSDPQMLLGASAQSCRAFALAQQMRAWFETLGYRFGSHEVWDADYFEWIIDIPVRRGRYDRVLVRGIDGEVGIKDVRSLSESVAAQKADEGWVVTARRISQAARGELATAECEGLAAFTLDELLDQEADFGGYLDWLAAEIKSRGIEARYVPIACTKEEVDPLTHQRLGISRYGESDGWTEGYMNLWLDDPAKEHLSILGEFGTGKTWLTLHYAAGALRAYREAKAKGMARPRLPIVIPLRDYAKAVSVESLFSEFFFRKHKLPIPHYDAFLQLNRMGKLLLIFDGFDEMAARVDKQQMINNFWELAKVVVPGSKVILTCRTEHFPEAREGRALLNAELQASTKGLSGETPQFEVLELEKFEDEQIRQVLSLSASDATVAQVMGNPQLLDLARRPVMTELILEALPEIEAGKPVDMSRVYLYAVRRKMERDIKADRTFTSMADKLYFLCELSWEMLSNDKMSINYREIPDRIRKLFGAAVQEEKDLDHWHYDMMGQTMLIRNADGDYTPAHRSLLEFFVAFKFAAELGALAPDFLELLKLQSYTNTAAEPQSCTWSVYFQRQMDTSRKIISIPPLDKFVSEDFKLLSSGFGRLPLTKALIDLMTPMLCDTISASENPLISLIEETSRKTEIEVGYIGGNITTLLIKLSRIALEHKNLCCTIIKGADFTDASLCGVDFTGAILAESTFSETFASILSVAFSSDGKLLATGDASAEIRLWNSENFKQILLLKQSAAWVWSLSFSPDNQLLASGYADGTIKLWNLSDGQCLSILKGHTNRVRTVVFYPDGRSLVSGSTDQTLRIWDVLSGRCIKILEGHSSGINSIEISSDNHILISASSDQTLRVWDTTTGQCLRILSGHNCQIQSIALSPEGTFLVSGGTDRTLKIWDAISHECLMTLDGHSSGVNSVAISSDSQTIASGGADSIVRIWDANGRLLQVLQGHTSGVTSVAFNPTVPILVSVSDDQTLRIWNFKTGACLKILQGYSSWIWSIALSPSNQILASAGVDKKISLWNVKTGKHLKTIEAHISGVKSVAFSPDGTILASASYDETIKLWNVENGRCLKALRGHSRRVQSVVFSPDGNLLATASDDETLKLWDAQTGDCRRTLKGHTGWVKSVAFSPAGDFLASGSDDRTVKIWDLHSGQCLKTLCTDTSQPIQAVAFNPDGVTIASAGSEGMLQTWNTWTGENLKTYEGHTDAVESVVFSHDGVTLASGSDDCTVKLWRTSTGECLETFYGHTNWVWSVIFSYDNMHLLSGSQDGTVKIWDIAIGKCDETLQSARPYEEMNITDVVGLSELQKITLENLGAIDKNIK